ncbi:dihydrofolate reductase [Candidatus Dependentiae bacterium]|nr:dihydrofolate reductase [Candidatus Dependentiae bacterium]
MIKIIAAMTKQGVIGKGNALPWNIPDELKNFRKLTQGHPIIMGSRTFESIGRPLPNRHNIVLGQPGLKIENVDVCHSVDDALRIAQADTKDIFIIGGAYTYAQFLPIADYLYLSYIKHNYEGDVFFPAVNWSDWEVAEHTDYPEFEFFVYKRIR